MVAFHRGELELARARYQTALACYQRIGFSEPLTQASYVRLAGVCLLALELDEAVRLSEECLSPRGRSSSAGSSRREKAQAISRTEIFMKS